MKTKQAKIDNLKKTAVDTDFVEITPETNLETENTSPTLEKKAEAAILEIDRRTNLDEAVENNLSSGLDSDPDFVTENTKINKKRVFYIKNSKDKINQETTEKKGEFVYSEELIEAQKALEEELSDPFAKYVYDQLAEENKKVLIYHLVDNAISPEKSEIVIESNSTKLSGEDLVKLISSDDILAYSDNGYLIKLINRSDLPVDTKIADKTCLYDLISPKGEKILQKIDYDAALMIMEEQAENYQQKLKESFNENSEEGSGVIESNEAEENSQIEINDSLSDSNTEAAVEIDQNLSTEMEASHEFQPSSLFNTYVLSKLKGFSKEELSGLSEKTLDHREVAAWNRKHIIKGVVSYSSVGYLTRLINVADVQDSNGIAIKSEKAKYSLIGPDGVATHENLSYQEADNLLWSESKKYLENLKKEFALNKEAIEKELTEPELISTDLESDSDLESSTEESDNSDFKNPFTQDISSYAESIGISPEELAVNQDFLQLEPAQQKFVLETLRRTALAKATVDGHENFIKEKSSKKIWQLGFLINQKYHKERHKIEALQNIESGGLETYGAEDLAWLTDIIKTGPEIKMNKEGEVLVNFLKTADFDQEDEAQIIKYNEIAREYLEYKPTEGKRDLRGYFAQELDNIYVELVNKAPDIERVNELFSKSHNNIELLRFLSADKETENILDKMSETSTDGLDRAKGMALGQMDKLGYSTLGFAIRTGSKFALANSAVLAGALSYSVAPMAAAIVGGFRAYNQGKNELKEKEELANLGVEDKSGLVKGKNLATYKEEKDGKVINFGLQEKLEVLIDQTKNCLSHEDCNRIIEKLRARISYTELKMSREEIDYGSIDERNINYLKLINTIAEAKATIGLHHFNSLHRKNPNIYSAFYNKGYSAFAGVNTYDSKIKIPERLKDESLENYKIRLSRDEKFVKYQSWATDEKRLEKLSEASLEVRLNSFLKYQEQKQTKKEHKYLLKKVASGAVMGASFAAVGAFVAEHLHLGLLNKETFSENVSASKTPETLVVESGSVEAPEPVQAAAIENISQEATPVVAPEAPLNVAEINQDGSVWQSTKELFKNQAEDLGYRGDLDNSQTLEKWAETQTAKALENSEVSDKIVFAGNQVKLIADGDSFRVELTQGSGPAPRIIEAETVSSNTEDLNSEPEQLSTPKENLIIETPEVETPKNIFNETVSNNLESDQLDNLMTADKSLISQQYKLPETDLIIKDDTFIYKKGNGTVIFEVDNKNKINLSFLEKNGQTIPKEFFDEQIGDSKIEKFISKKSDKSFISWNKLSLNDKEFYYNLAGLHKKIFNPQQLLEKIKISHQIDTNDLYIDETRNKIVTGSGKEFSLSVAGLKKLAKLFPQK